MKGASILLLAAAAGVGTFAFTRPAAALGPIDLEAGARVGYGSSPYKDSDFNVMNVGIGARAGLSIFNIYAGASVMYYFGSSHDNEVVKTPTGLGTAKVSGTSFMYGIEGGYNFSLLFLTIRPQIGVGNFQTHLSWNGGSANAHNIYIEPRATALIGISFVYFGADIGVLLTPGLSDSKAAVLANGQLGVKF
jgi:hypothetical protein